MKYQNALGDPATKSGDGDTLVVWKLDRLGRNLKHLISIVEDLAKRNIGFKVLSGQGVKRSAKLGS